MARIKAELNAKKKHKQSISCQRAIVVPDPKPVIE